MKPRTATRQSTGEDEKTCEFNIVTDTELTFTNSMDIIPDTGISLDSLPYILLLTFAGAAGIFLALRKRHNYDI